MKLDFCGIFQYYIYRHINDQLFLFLSYFFVCFPTLFLLFLKLQSYFYPIFYICLPESLLSRYEGLETKPYESRFRNSYYFWIRVWIWERVNRIQIRIRVRIRVRVRIKVKFKIQKNTKLQKSKNSNSC